MDDTPWSASATLAEAGEEAGDRARLVASSNSQRGGLVGPDGLPRKDLGMPTLNGEAVASLTTCSVNLDASCDIHNATRYRRIMETWRNPAPRGCQPRRAPPPPPAAAFADRLAANMDPTCDALT